MKNYCCRILYITEYSLVEGEKKMEVSPTEAEQALTVIESMVKKTRRAVSSSGAYLFLIVWGAIWLIGFACSQFLAARLSGRSGQC